MKYFIGLVSISLSLMFTSAVAETAESADVVSTVPPTITETIIKAIESARPNIKVESVTASPASGLFEVKVANGPTLYTTVDGSFFVLGDLYQVTPKGFVNIAEKQREVARASKLAEVDVKDMIVFSPAQQPAKASIMVFTDVDCFYCQKLHKEVPDLNRIGIEVRYLAFPRAGIGSDSYKKIATAWCADDRQAALTKLKNREYIPINVCAGNPVAKQYALGNALGVNGTPALLTAEGQLMPGYMPALQLAHVLGVEVDPAIASELAAKQQQSMR